MPHLLHHLLEAAAVASPDKEALVEGGRRFSYREFAARVESFAAVLHAHGLRRRDRIAIFLDKSIDEACGIFGSARAGGVFVPVNALLRPRQVLHILDDCRARFLMTSRRHLEALSGVLPKAISVERILLVDEEVETRDDGRAVVGAFARPAVSAPPPATIGEDLAAILYTSGSTGPPKGVMVSHRSLLAGSRIVCRYLGIRHDERILSILPFSFDYGLNQIITAVDMGATTVLLTFQFGDEIVRTIRAERVTALAGVPTLWTLLTHGAAGFRRQTLASLRYITNSGGSVPTETLTRLRQAQPHVEVFLMYGFTEAFRSTYLPPEELSRRPTSIGKAIPETDIFHVDDTGRLCGPGEVGILVHHGPTISLGYWGRTEETETVLRPHPFIRRDEGGPLVCYSGDRVTMDEAGYFYFLGRNDMMIKSSGYRISPSEVEEALMRTGLLSQAAVFGMPDPVLGEKICAACVAEGGLAANRDELLARCGEELPPHMMPREIEFVTELPLSPNGKVDYRALRAAGLERDNDA